MWKWEAVGEAKAVIVMVHGALEHHGRYGWLIEQWQLAGFHVIMGDLPGQGLTARTNRGHIESFDDYLHEVREWILAAYDFDLPVFLLGHGMGGLISIRILQEERMSLAGVILSSPSLGLVQKLSKLQMAKLRAMNIIMPTYKINPGFSVNDATRNNDVREADLNDGLTIKKVSVSWYSELLEAIQLAFESIENTNDIPMLLMQSGEDKIVEKKAVKDWFNHAPLSEKRYKEWPSYYHEIFNEPDRYEVFEYALDFAIGQLKSIGYLY